MANKEEKLRVRADEKFVAQMDAYIKKRNKALTEHKMTRSSLIREAVRAWIQENPASKLLQEQRAKAKRYGAETIEETNRPAPKFPGGSKTDTERGDQDAVQRQ